MVTYTLHDGGSAVPLVGALAELYAAVYAEPPYNEGPEQVRHFADSLHDHAGRVGFTLITAADDGEIVGAAYGWTMLPGDWWSRADRPPAAEVQAAAKLAVMEWIVHPTRRGEGIGAELMRRLLTDRVEEYATLASDPKSHARRVYARNGWRQVGKSALPWGPPMDLLVLDLAGQAGAGAHSGR